MSKFTTVVVIVIVFLIGFLMIRYSTDNMKPSNSGNMKTSNKEITSTMPVVKQSLMPNFEGWREFSPASGKFKVMFPSIPQNTSDSILDKRLNQLLEYNTFIATEENGPVVVVTTITYPKEIEGKHVEETLRGLVDDMLVRNKKNTLEYANLETLSSHPSLDFSLMSGELSIVGKIIVHKNMVYILTMANELTMFNSDELNFFLNSFILNDK